MNLNRSLKYDVTIRDKEGNASYTHDNVNHEEAMRLVSQFGGDPEYDTDVRIVEEKEEKEIAWIH